MIDRRTVGEGDVAIWHEIIGKLPKDLARQAVIDHAREQPGVWLEPGHIHQRVRAIQRDRYERMTADDRSALERNMFGACADEGPASAIGELAEAKTIPPADPPPRDSRSSVQERPSALSVACPYCQAGFGRACKAMSTGQPMQHGLRCHPSLADAAAAEAASTAARGENTSPATSTGLTLNHRSTRSCALKNMLSKAATTRCCALCAVNVSLSLKPHLVSATAASRLPALRRSTRPPPTRKGRRERRLLVRIHGVSRRRRVRL